MLGFKYSVIRYVNDIVKDEAINIGIIINENNTQTFTSKLIEDLDVIKKIHKTANIAPIIDIVETLRKEHESEYTLSTLSKKFQYQLRFTEPRAIIASDAHKALDDLYGKYISIENNFQDKNQRTANKLKIGQ